MTLKKWDGVGEYGILSTHFFSASFSGPPPVPQNAADPILIMYPLRLRGNMISMGSAAQGGEE